VITPSAHVRKKKEMPADKTLRLDNVYFPAYTQFTSPNVTK
jgi:hypothetical protein